MDAKDEAKIKNAVARLFRQSETYKKAMDSAVSLVTKGNRGGKRYHCSKCKNLFMVKDMQVDHFLPVVPIGMKKSELTIQEYINRVYCHVHELQVLCKPCHHKKSVEENAQRRA